MLVLGYIGSTSAPDESTIKVEAHAVHCTLCYVVLFLICLRCSLSPRRSPLQKCRPFFEHTQQMPRDRCSVCIKLHALAPFAKLTKLLSKLRTIAGFSTLFHQPTRCWFHVWFWSWFGWHPHYQFCGPLSNCLVFGHSAKYLRRSRQLVRLILLFFLRPVPNREKEFLALSMSRSSAAAFNIICRLDRNRELEEVSRDKEQKAVTSPLRDELHLKDLAGPFSSRASKVLGLISRCRIAGILLHMKFASSRASRHGFTVCFLRIFPRILYGTKISHWRCGTNVNAWMNPTLYRITTNDLSCTKLFSSILGSGYGVSTDKPSSPWFDHPSVLSKSNMESWWWVSVTHLCMLIFSTVQASRIRECWWMHDRVHPIHDVYHYSRR